MVGHGRTAAALIAGCLLTLAGAGCAGGASPFTNPSRPVEPPPTVGTVDAKVHPRLAEFRAFEVAVQRPTATGVAVAARESFRAGLYDGLLERGYSPLAMDYVDAAHGGAAAVPRRTFPMRARITSVEQTREGGHVVSGWVGLVSLDADGTEETLYVSEITRLAVPPQTGRAVRDGGADTGRRLAAALLRHLPAR